MGEVGRVADAKSSDPATPQNLERALNPAPAIIQFKSHIHFVYNI